jgi:hypothetical protein
VERLRYTNWNFLLDDLAGDQDAAFPFERELLLYQFQTWIYIPHHYLISDKRHIDVVTDAGIVAAGKFLERLGRPYLDVKGLTRYSTRRLAMCLEDEGYRSLYNTVLKRHGGWTSLLYATSADSIDAMLADRRDGVETVCEIIDYRFRYLDHDGPDRRVSNLSHGKYFRWTNKRSSLSGNTINMDK